MANLRSLNIAESPMFFEATMRSRVLQNNLRALKLNEIKQEKLFDYLLRFKRLEHLRLANMYFVYDKNELKKVFPVFRKIKNLELIRNYISLNFFELIGRRGINASKFTFIGNLVYADRNRLGKLKWKLKFVTHLTCCAKFAELFNKEEYPNYFLGAVPN
jgi:hypothetical protein